MIIGTTPTLVLKIKRTYDVDLRTVGNLTVTFKQGSTTITKSGTDLNFEDAKTVTLNLTQAESLSLVLDKDVEMQMNWTYTDDSGNTQRAATQVVKIDLEKQLVKEELGDG